MAMKKATKERITAAYDKGFADGEKSGHARATEFSNAVKQALEREQQARTKFTLSLDAEGDPE